MTKTQMKDLGDDEGLANDVRLVGRLTGEPALVELPSGDALVTFRISVPRSSSTGGPGTGSAQAATRRVDSVPCTAWSPRLRRSILTWRAGDLVEVSGAVRCRFFQAGGATRSRVEVEATSARIMRRSSAA
ncbi:single-stranded DNA-binding protein [Nocardioides sp.]|uniref:single-stranded DNA-binding protein n=1 Tax=Nocardioides sp. TaxID=35761 RepID=UPI0026204EF5|nr:single-stranded DNA-binding protein [Nocardioides sp.]MCW2738754.1 single-strand binding protein/Primosomal replication protein n [Nocardioides sp.]